MPSIINEDNLVKTNNMIEILRGSYIEIMSIKNLLENNNILVFIGNEYMSTIQPWLVSPGGSAPAVLNVKEEDYENAKEIIKDYNDGKYSLDL